ncbi:MAG: 1-acyl-sn-glycerol-3-phosphate acyltransferase [Clostridia bacterium]|nr:1-acyl-sn-glycerol-3-phosphate acyltransferase [Clostridia bacterium]
MNPYKQPKSVMILIATLIPVFKLLFRYEIIGKENLPEKGGIVYASNHISFADPILWILAIRRRICYMAKAELYKHAFLRGVFKLAGVFPVERGKASINSVNNAIGIVKNGGILGIFPEGTRSKDGKPIRAKSGVAYIANATGADVVPMAIVTKGKVKPFKKVYLYVGKPIPHSEIYFEGADRKGLRNASERIMGEITNLWEEGQNEL